MTDLAVAPPAAGLRETDLYRLWLEQRFPHGALVTAGGEPVTVGYRGRPGRGAGPDFRDARIGIGGAPARLGDVELHVSAADFRRHGHATDPAYARVVLHVVFDPGTARETPLPGGGVAPLLALRQWVEQRSAEISAWLERSRAWREPCHGACGRLGVARVDTILHEEGARRLEAKAAAVANLAGDDEQQLYRAICGALGLTRNVQPFQALAERLPVASLLADIDPDRSETRAARFQERLLAAAGFGPNAPLRGALPWRLDGLRPGAHPMRRIEGLAHLLARHGQRGLTAAIERACVDGPTALVRALAAPGIGRTRAVEIAVNAVLPWLLARGEGALALDLATRLPAPAAYGPLATLDAALAPPIAADRRVQPSRSRASVLAQQGALALHGGWCQRGGCGVCPLS